MMSFIRPRGISIFVFHSTEEDENSNRSWITSGVRFRDQLDFIAENFRVLPVSEMLRARGKVGGGKPPACITFDDGYPSWSGVVLDELKCRDLSATFYVSTDSLNGRPIWHDRLSCYLDALRMPVLNVPSLGIRNMRFEHAADRKAHAAQIVHLFKYQHPAVRERMLGVLQQIVGPSAPAKSLEASDLRLLASQGHEIGSHTLSHPILSFCDDAQAYAEIAESREVLASMIGAPIQSFSYPNGKPGIDYAPKHVEMVRKAGYASAVSTGFGGAPFDKLPLWQIPRFMPWGHTRTAMARQVLRNSWSSVQAVKESGRSESTRIMVVENGTGFGGSVVALRAMVQQTWPVPHQFCIVSGHRYELDAVPSVAKVVEASSRSPWFHRLTRRWTNDPRRWVLLMLARADDFLVRLPYLLRLLVVAARFRPDIVHGNNDLIANREALLAAKLMRIPYLQHVRGPFQDHVRSQHLINLPDAYVSVSRWLHFHCVDRGARNAQLIQLYDGVAPTRAQKYDAKQPAVPGGAIGPRAGPVVAMIGMLVPWKGQALFLDAVAPLCQIHANVRFLIVGGQPDLAPSDYEAQLRRTVEERHLEDRVTFLGQVPDLGTQMAAFDVVVSASLSPEPLGLVMIEALQHGCYFVGPDHGATAEFIADASMGRLFEAGSAASLRDTLDCVLSDLSIFDVERRRGRAHLPPEVSTTLHAQALSTVYQALILKSSR